MDFDNKLTVVAGGNSGIGLEIAKGFFKRGSKVIILGRRRKKNQQALSIISKENKFGILKAYVCDLSKESHLSVVAKKIFNSHGKIDNFVNSIGLWKIKPISKLTKNNITEMHDNNFLPLVMGCKIIPSFMSGGSIVNLSSFASLMPMKEGSIYSSYKSAAITFTKSAAAELSQKGIRVNIVTPGVIETPMTKAHIKRNKRELLKPIPMKRIGSPEDVVGPVLFLCSNLSSYITGENIIISGGKYIIQQ
jgi:3-oxoacyl-[acyl-carrier protein] reductase